MYISKQSTIYCSYAFLTELSGKTFYPPYSLCAFVRGYLWLLLKSSIVAFFLAFIVTSTLQGFFCVAFLNHDFAGPILNTYVFVALLVCAITGCVGFILFILLLHEKYNQAKEDRALLRGSVLSTERRQPNIFYLYFKALHDKVCPIIEFRNEKE